MLDFLVELIGFACLIAAAATVSYGLALVVAGVGFIVFANRPTKPKGDSAGPS